jgi:hypothetical protein
MLVVKMIGLGKSGITKHVLLCSFDVGFGGINGGHICTKSSKWLDYEINGNLFTSESNPAPHPRSSIFFPLSGRSSVGEGS